MDGQTDFRLPPPQAAQPLLRRGQLRALAFASTHRLRVLCELPSIAAPDFPCFRANDWGLLFGSTGLPAATVEPARRCAAAWPR